jgi:hypothetical protein
MSQQLRQRSKTPPGATTARMDHGDYPSAGAGLTVPQMLKASPQQHGLVMKLHVSPLYSYFPIFLQRLIARIWCLSFLAPKWESRYLILLGSFLYKFTDKASSPNSKDTPKGSPVPIETVDVEIIELSSSLARAEHHHHHRPMAMALQKLPPGFKCVFSVSRLHKTHYYATTDREQATEWLNSLREARQEAITRRMGHAPDASFPKAWTNFDNLGRNLMKSKDRIRASIEENSRRELEMSNLTEGGPFPRGYHG